MKIAFVTSYDASDVNSWSGIPFYMSRAFRDAGVEVELIGNLKELPRNFFSEVKNKLYIRYFKKTYRKYLRKHFGIYDRVTEPENLKYFSRQVNERIKSFDADIILSPGAYPIAYLDTEKPIVLWTDATFASMPGYWPGYSDLTRQTVRNCHLYEENVLKRSQLACFSSDWAANSAINYYKADPNKVKIIPFGANVECNRTENDIVELNKQKSKSVCKLLFVGNEWVRKGGETAVNVVKELNRRNIKTELTIIGADSRDSSAFPDYIKVLGYVDKSKESGRNLINSLYYESHFFILPSIADCTPIVFSEANSFGLPVITRNTGGIPSIIKNDVNGKMFDKNLDFKQCADYIEEIYNNSEKYNDLSLSSFNEYKTRLNWNSSINLMILYMRQILKVRGQDSRL